MRVSIIIPCFRQAHYLPTALESCFAQTHADTEVIVVNDGSDDDTEAVSRGYGDRVRYVYRTNGGLSAARNTGIAAATGRLLKFLDADDHLHPEQLERQVAALRSHPQSVSVTTVRGYQDGRPEVYEDYVPEYRAFLPDLLRNPDGGVHGYLFPADLVRAVNGFDETCRIAEDWEFFCRLGRRRAPVVCDPRVGAYYRLRAGSMSAAKSRMAAGVARQLIAMHDEFRDGPNREWFGPDLLGAEQRTYRSLLISRTDDTELANQLLHRLLELWRLCGPPVGVSRKFLALRRVVGHRLAERIYARYARHRLEYAR